MNPPDRMRHLGVALALAVTTLATYWPVGNHAFIDLDTPAFVTENPRVLAGLTTDGVAWAFTTTETGNWHPLTWLSHMLDCQLFGPDPGWHLRVNLALHVANTMLLLCVLQAMTGSLWPSAFVAALFALHPLHVESVAWVAERKDVLSAFFWLLTLLAYARYVKRPGLWRYLPVLAAFTLGLMSKPMLVTLPFVLLLLDYWPLGRLSAVSSAQAPAGSTGAKSSDPGRQESLGRFMIEKIPLFALTAFSIATTLYAQRSVGAVAPLEIIPFSARLANALVSYVLYMAKTLWPSRLAVFYPHPGDTLPLWEAAGAAALLTGITLVTLWKRKEFSSVLVGWLWYLGTLVPVIGLVQVGGQAMADRYTYVPLTGLFVAAAWGIQGLVGQARNPRACLAIGATAVLAPLLVATRLQLAYWKDSQTLYEHSIKVTRDNALVHMNLGNVLIRQGKIEEGMKHHAEAARIKPQSATAHTNLGAALALQGKHEEAIACYRKALQFHPGFADAHHNLGLSLLRTGRPAQAEPHFVEALRLKPVYPDALTALGSALTKQNRLEEAMKHLYRALELRPRDAEAHLNLGLALAKQGKLKEAIEEYSRAIEEQPGLADAHINAGVALASLGQPEKAMMHYSRAIELKPGSAEALHNMGNLMNAQGKADEAEGYYRGALEADPSLAEPHLSLGLLFYRQGKLDEAQQHLEEAVKKKPDSSEAHDSLGVVLGIRGRPLEAVEHLKQATQLRPANSSAHNNLGALLFRLGRQPEAIEHYHAAVKADPKNVDAHYNLGAALHQEGKIEEAAQHYTAALAANPKYVEAHNNLGVALYQQGKTEEAIRHFEEALRIDPNHPGARDNLKKLQSQRRP